MPDIKRLDVTKPCFMLESPDGHYISYADHIAALEAVKAAVKALEWHAYPEDGSRSYEGQNQQRNFVSRALLPWGAALFVMEKDGVFTLTLSMQDMEGIFSSEEAAKAAAQADYEQRIRSALVPSPALEANQQVIETLRAEIERLLAAVQTIRAGYGSNHLSRWVLKVVSAALTPPTQDEVK